MSEVTRADIDLTRLEVFFGECTPAAARVYARLPGVKGRTDVKLTGEVFGPLCRWSTTLPARIPLVDQGPGAMLLAQALVPDPCFWSPEMPFLYVVTIEVVAVGCQKGPVERTIGVRPLAVRGRRLIYEGKPWVLRGVSQKSTVESSLDAWRDVGAAMLVDAPSEDLCREASQIGVLLVAQVSGSPDLVGRELRRLADHPAVGLAALSSDGELDPSVRRQVRNLLLCQTVVAGRPFGPAPWAQVAICPAEDLAACADTADTSRLPLVALRRLAAPTTPPDVRSCVDHLQRDLAGRGEFAGYLV